MKKSDYSTKVKTLDYWPIMWFDNIVPAFNDESILNRTEMGCMFVGRKGFECHKPKKGLSKPTNTKVGVNGRFRASPH